MRNGAAKDGGEVGEGGRGGGGGRPCRDGILEFAQDARELRKPCQVYPDFLGSVLLPRVRVTCHRCGAIARDCGRDIIANPINSNATFRMRTLVIASISPNGILKLSFRRRSIFFSGHAR